jgi:thioredoxin 1
MKTPARIIIILLVVGAVATAIILKHNKSRNFTNSSTPGGTTTSAVSDAAAKLPRLLDLGANKCIPCKAMTPILEGLKKEYAGKLNVEFIDVWQNEDAGKKYGVEIIPTQIFFDAAGKELFRHTGFFGKEDILAKWKELGLDF